MIKLKRVVTDNGFILEEIDTGKINKELIDAGQVKPVDLPHVDNTAESAQEHIDAVKKIVDKEKEEMEKKALETKGEDRAIFAESKLFKDRSEMSSFIVQLKEQKIKHRVVPLHEDKEGYRFELKYEKPLDTALNESYETAFEMCKDGSKVSAVGSFKHTKNYTHELVDFECALGSGSGDYRWMNRPWERFTFAEALREAMINAGVDEKCARACIENSFSLKSAIKYYADNCCKKEEDKPEESLKKEELTDDAHDDFTHKLYSAVSGVVEEFIDKGLTDTDLVTALEFVEIHLGDDFDFDESLKEDVTYYAVYIDKDGNEEPQEGSESKNREDVEDLIADWTARDACEDGCSFEVRAKKESLKEDKKEDAKELETFDEKMDFLVADEDEAIKGYDKIIASLDPKEDAHVIEQLTHIREEELLHKEFLAKVKEDREAVYSHEEETDDDVSDFDLDGADDEVEVVDEFSWDDLDDEFDESLEEDTVKKGNKWVNKGKEGTHGEFRTKKEADAQRKAMFANGFKEELEESNDNELPKEVVIDKEELEFEDGMDEDEIIGDYLSNKYGFCHYGFKYEIKDDKVYVSNIEWDTSESLKGKDMWSDLED